MKDIFSSPWLWLPCQGCGSWTWGDSLQSSTCSTHLQKSCKNYQTFDTPTKSSGFSYKVLDYKKKKKIWCLEFCQDIWKDWDQHFNIKILHFSSAKHSISKILKWRRFFIFWSFVKFCHLGKFLKEVGSNILGESAFEDDDN